MTKILLYFTLLIGFGLQAVFLSQAGLYFLNIILIIFLFGWALSQKFNLTWMINIILVADILLIAWLSFFGFEPIILILSVVFILAGLNLTNFQNLLKQGDPNRKYNELELRHLVKLSIFILFSLIISLGATLIELEITFLQSIILLIITFIGLMQVLRWFLNQTNTG